MSESVRVLHGDCLRVMRLMRARGVQVDSIVTDPPYHLSSIVRRLGKPGSAPIKDRDGLYARQARGFMGKEWDGGDIAMNPETWALAYDVLKPGGHLIALCGTRTEHRVACAIEDAGFEIRDRVVEYAASTTASQNFVASLNDEQRSALCRLIDDQSIISRLFWNYGSGFPKSHNVSNQIDRCACEVPDVRHATAEPATVATSEILRSSMRGSGQANASGAENMRGVRDVVESGDTLSGGAEQDVFAGVFGAAGGVGQDRSNQGATGQMRDLRKAGVSGAQPESADAGQRGVLQPDVLGPNAGGTPGRDCAARRSSGHTRGEGPSCSAGSSKSFLQIGNHLPASQGQLRKCALREVSAGVSGDGAEGRLCDGAPAGDGAVDRPNSKPNGVRTSSGSRSAEQSADQSGTVAGQSQPQAGGAWPTCGRCGKPIVPDGLGTALKPAVEIGVLARKPLSEKSVAANVLAHGTGALNIDGTRIHADDAQGGDYRVKRLNPGASVNATGDWKQDAEYVGHQKPGRWPANVLHDGSPEVVEAFAAHGERTSGKPGVMRKGTNDGAAYGAESRPPGTPMTGIGDTGSAARFFYSSKADAADRLGSKHPTVKPVDLMAYLARLITPPGGLALDPFAGSGTTGMACLREGFRCVLIEREAEYVADIRRRLQHVRGEDTPLFQAAQTDVEDLL